MHGKINAFECRAMVGEEDERKRLFLSQSWARYIYSNISHDLPIIYRNWRIKHFSEIWGSLLLLRRFFIRSFCDLQETGMLFYCDVFMVLNIFIPPRWTVNDQNKRILTETAEFWRTQKQRRIHKFVGLLIWCFMEKVLRRGQKLINNSIKSPIIQF